MGSSKADCGLSRSRGKGASWEGEGRAGNVHHLLRRVECVGRCTAGVYWGGPSRREGTGVPEDTEVSSDL